jgi:hypothetical protein
LLNRLQQLLKQKKSNYFYAKKLNVTLGKVLRLREELKGKEVHDSLEDLNTLETEEVTKKVDVEKGTVQSTRETTFDPQTVEQLAKLHKIDLSKYKISNYWSKLKSNGKFTSSVFATLKKPADYSPEDFTKFLKTYKPSPVKITKIARSINKDTVDVEISIADFHLDRKVLAGDTLEKRKDEYRNLIDGLLTKVQSCYNIDVLIFVIGNDFFNTDNYHNQTTNLTPQEITTPWDKAYEQGFDLLVETITKLEKVTTQLDVVLIQGNHDRTKSFYLAHALEVFFKDNERISFDRVNSNTKFVVLGKTFIGYHHGNHIKIDNLPLYFQNDEKSSIAYGGAKYREVHTGDKHHYMAKDVQGVRIQQIPSMVKPDNYTNDGLYLHVKAGLALCYHPVHGKCAEFEQRL